MMLVKVFYIVLIEQDNPAFQTLYEEENSRDVSKGQW